MTQALLAPVLAADQHNPRLVVHAAGGRTELSAASLANWSAKVAGLLVDELGAGPGDQVSVRLSAGWQTAPVLLGCWWAGTTVTTADDETAVAAFVPNGGDAAADEVFVVSGHPLGAPATQVRAHQRDFTTAVLAQADRFSPAAEPHDGMPALLAGGTSLTNADLLSEARSAGEQFGTGARVLSRADWVLPEPAVSLLLGTLAAEGSLVQIVPDGTAVDVEAIAAEEKCTVRWGAG